MRDYEGFTTYQDCFNFNHYGERRPHLKVDYVTPDPSKADYCTRTLARLGENECHVNHLTNDVFNKVGRELWYVGPSQDDPEADVSAWCQWLLGMRAVQ